MPINGVDGEAAASVVPAPHLPSHRSWTSGGGRCLPSVFAALWLLGVVVVVSLCVPMASGLSERG